jgi:hypothetical protein
LFIGTTPLPLSAPWIASASTIEVADPLDQPTITLDWVEFTRMYSLSEYSQSMAALFETEYSGVMPDGTAPDAWVDTAAP